MDILAFLFLFIAVLVIFKIGGLIFKAAFFLISIPLQILAALIVTVVLLAIVPITLFSGILGLILLPLGLLAPLLPLLLIGFGIYLLARR